MAGLPLAQIADVLPSSWVLLEPWCVLPQAMLCLGCLCGLNLVLPICSVRERRWQWGSRRAPAPCLTGTQRNLCSPSSWAQAAAHSSMVSVPRGITLWLAQCLGSPVSPGWGQSWRLCLLRLSTRAWLAQGGTAALPVHRCRWQPIASQRSYTWASSVPGVACFLWLGRKMATPPSPPDLLSL